MSIDEERREQIARDYTIAAGEVCLASAELENILILLFSTLMKERDQFRSRIVWSSLPNLQARRRLLERLALNYLDDATLQRMKKLLKRVSSLGSKRNLIVHALSGVKSDGNINFTRLEMDTVEGTEFVHMESYSLENVEGWPRAIRALVKDIVGFLGEMEAKVQDYPKANRTGE